MTRTTARVMLTRGQAHWPAGALLWKARQKASKQDKKTRKAASRKAAAAEAAWRLLPAFV
jgi:hypothetical protein